MRSEIVQSSHTKSNGSLESKKFPSSAFHSGNSVAPTLARQWESLLALYVLHIYFALTLLIAIQVIGTGLTASVLSFTLFQHKYTREQQSRLLRQQALLVRSIVDQRIVSVDDAVRITGNRDHPTRQWKNAWNTEVENTVKWCHTFQWDDLRVGIMDKVDQIKDEIRKA